MAGHQHTAFSLLGAPESPNLRMSAPRVLGTPGMVPANLWEGFLITLLAAGLPRHREVKHLARSPAGRGSGQLSPAQPPAEASQTPMPERPSSLLSPFLVA